MISLALATGITATAAWAENHVQQGVLRCDVAGGVGLILGSSKKMICEFERNDCTVEQYTGRVLKIGVDIGATKGLENRVGGVCIVRRLHLGGLG